MKRELILSIILSTIILCKPLFAYDEDIAHPEITESAVGPANSSLRSYLISNLGLVNGLDTEFKNKDTNITYTILDWLRQGSKDEDSPPCRATNHFHNPLLPWDQSYMNDDTTPLGMSIRADCSLDGWPYSERKSNVTCHTEGSGLNIQQAYAISHLRI